MYQKKKKGSILKLSKPTVALTCPEGQPVRQGFPCGEAARTARFSGEKLRAFGLQCLCVFPSLSFSLTSDISICWCSESLRSGSNGPECSRLVLLVFPGFRASNLQIHLIPLQIFLPGKLFQPSPPSILANSMFSLLFTLLSLFFSLLSPFHLQIPPLTPPSLSKLKFCFLSLFF